MVLRGGGNPNAADAAVKDITMTVKDSAKGGERQ